MYCFTIKHSFTHKYSNFVDDVMFIFVFFFLFLFNSLSVKGPISFHHVFKHGALYVEGNFLEAKLDKSQS